MTCSNNGSGSVVWDAKRNDALAEVAGKRSKVGFFKRVLLSLSSPMEAIKAFCYLCNGMDESACRNCVSTQCPLWNFRPYQEKGDGQDSQTCPQNVPIGGFMDQKRALMLDQVSKDAPGKIGLFRRLYQGLNVPTQAIKGKCLECVWMNEKDIKGCKETGCMIWHFKPYTEKT